MKRLIIAILLAAAFLLTSCDQSVSEDVSGSEYAAEAQAASDTAIAPPADDTDKQMSADIDRESINSTADENEENAADEQANGYYGALHVEKGRLMSEKGEHVQLKGISTHGLSWFPQYVNSDMMKQAQQDFGCNVFRLAMYTAESNGYLTGGDDNKAVLKSLIDEAVTAAEELRMYVIIDWHTLSDNDPLENADEAAAFFSEMSEKYKDKEHVIYEICNEPNGDTSWADVKQYADRVIPEIRRNTDAVILTGTPQWCQRILDAAADPLQYDNVMYTLHFYAATHKEDLRQTLREAAESGFPVFVSEFGICDASGSGAIDTEQAGLWMDVINEYGISCVMWNLSNKDESSAMIKSSCGKTSGFTDDELSPAGLWFKQMNVENTLNMSNNGEESQGAPSGAENARYPSYDGEKSQSAPNGAEDSHSMPDSAQHSLTADLSLANSWQQGADSYYQYNLTITNETGSAVSGWDAHILFSQNVSIDNSWNGEFFTNGLFIDISPAPYNAEIAAGGSVSDIGFIVKSASSLKTEEVSVK